MVVADQCKSPLLVASLDTLNEDLPVVYRHCIQERDSRLPTIACTSKQDRIRFHNDRVGRN